MTPELQSRFFSLLSAGLYNLYGPTETTISSTFWKCQRDHETVPIGRPIANVEVFVLDGDLQPTPIGVPGELYIGGIGLARGYLNRPELTAERFIPHPFSNQAGSRLYKTGDRVRWSSDGNLEFLGRTDGQVKLRGFRIELGEIEAVLRTHPAVSETVVVLHDALSARARLVCYFTPRGSHIPSASDLSNFLGQNLPRHMIPAVWVKLDTLPLNANGKVDRKALPAPETSRLEPRETYAAPRTPIEELLTGIWCDLLRVERVGINDNFFDLGGHSLLAIQLFARIEQRFQKRLPLALLFQHGTVAGIARHLTDEAQDDRDAAVVELQPGAAGQRRLFFMPNLWGELMDGRMLLGHLGKATPVYGVQPRLSANRLEQSADFESTAAACVEALREFQPHGPYALIGYSYGGMLAYEVARQIAELGDVVDLLVILDTGPANRGHVSTASEHFVRWVRVLRNLPRWIVDDANNSPRDLYRCARRRLRSIAPPRLWRFISGMKGANYEVATDTAGISRQDADRGAAQNKAVGEYMPKAYPGVVTLFRSRTQPLFAGSRDDLGWNRFALGGVDIRLVPGHHLVLMNEPYVRRIAQELQKCLRALEAGKKGEGNRD